MSIRGKCKFLIELPQNMLQDIREIKLLSLRKVYNEIVIAWRSPNVTKSAINRSERTLNDIYVQRAFILVNVLNTTN